MNYVDTIQKKQPLMAKSNRNNLGCMEVLREFNPYLEDRLKNLVIRGKLIFFIYHQIFLMSLSTNRKAGPIENPN